MDGKFLIRPATKADVWPVTRIIAANDDAHGWIPNTVWYEAVEKGQLYVAEEVESHTVVGMLYYHHRKRTLVTYLGDICVKKEYRKFGIGAALIDVLKARCLEDGREGIELYCPANLPSNTFYQHYGFLFTGTRPGRVRTKNVWFLKLEKAA